MIDGPRIAPAGGGAAKSLVVFLHGYGADGNDLIGLGREWAPALPATAFVSPHAPEPCQGAPMGRQWFPLTMRDPQEFVRGVANARPALDTFLDAELQRHGLDESACALVGFSQGTMMALHVGPQRQSEARRHTRLFGASRRSRRAEARARPEAAGPPDPRRQRRPHSGRRHLCRGGGSGGGGDSRRMAHLARNTARHRA